MSNGKINVDDFLETIMDSEKFDEIADKIASKAVEKFSKLKNVNTETAPDPNVESNDDPAYRGAEDKIKDPNISEPNLDNSEAEESTTQRYVGKIDNEAFMKKESADASKHLSLKFKYFKKISPSKKSKEIKEKPVLDTEDVNPSKEINDYEEAENNQSEQKVSETKVKEPESDIETTTTIKTDGNYISTKVNKKKKKKTEKLTTPQDKDGKESSREKESQIEMEDKSNAASEQKEITKKKRSERKKSRAKYKDRSVEVNNEGSFEHAIKLNKDDDTKHSEEKSEAEYRVRKPAYEYLKLPDPDLLTTAKNVDNVEKTTLKLRLKDKIKFSKVTVKQKETNSSKPTHPPAPILIREEGNTLYTQERSPDYEEYHNEISRIQSDLKNRASIL